VGDLRGVGIHGGRIWIREGGDFLVIVFAVAGFLPPFGSRKESPLFDALKY
jgi:hypothetical protein